MLPSGNEVVAGVTVRVFYDPQRVEQLRQQGIDPRRQRQLSNGGETSDVAQARTSLELVEENARLRAEAARLRGDIQRLTEEVARLRGAGSAVREPSRRDLDDAAQRFSLIELDL